MIDEWFEGVVDRLCVSVPRRVKPWLVRLSGSCVVWRILLYATSVGRVIAGAFGSISSEETIDSFLTEAVEGGVILGTNANDAGDIRNSPAMDQAYQLGRDLAE